MRDGNLDWTLTLLGNNCNSNNNVEFLSTATLYFHLE